MLFSVIRHLSQHATCQACQACQSMVLTFLPRYTRIVNKRLFLTNKQLRSRYFGFYRLTGVMAALLMERIAFLDPLPRHVFGENPILPM